MAPARSEAGQAHGNDPLSSGGRDYCGNRRPAETGDPATADRPVSWTFTCSPRMIQYRAMALSFVRSAVPDVCAAFSDNSLAFSKHSNADIVVGR